MTNSAHIKKCAHSAVLMNTLTDDSWSVYSLCCNSVLTSNSAMLLNTLTDANLYSLCCNSVLTFIYIIRVNHSYTLLCTWTYPVVNATQHWHKVLSVVLIDRYRRPKVAIKSLHFWFYENFNVETNWNNTHITTGNANDTGTGGDVIILEV